jgi:hypothetical protein
LQALAEVTASREDATGQITIRRRLFVLSRPVTADALECAPSAGQADH